MQKTLTCINVTQTTTACSVQFGIVDPKNEKAPQLIAVIQTTDPEEVKNFTIHTDYIIDIKPAPNANKKSSSKK